MKVNPITNRLERTPAEIERHRFIREGMKFDHRPTFEEVIHRFRLLEDALAASSDQLDIHSLVQSLRQERERLGLSLDEVAKRTGWNPQMVARLENDEETVSSLDMLTKWANAFGKKLRLDIVDR